MPANLMNISKIIFYFFTDLTGKKKVENVRFSCASGHGDIFKTAFTNLLRNNVRYVKSEDHTAHIIKHRKQYEVCSSPS